MDATEIEAKVGTARTAAAPGADVRQGKILIVDDEPINVKALRRHLQDAGFERFVTTTDATQALELVCREQPDLILLDYLMPGRDGLSILQALRVDLDLGHVPVLMLTASRDAAVKLRALELGAHDFLAKPIDPSELVPRVRNSLVGKAHRDALERHSIELEKIVRARTAELVASRLEIVHCLARAAEHRDDVTGRHVLRVGKFTGIIAGQLGFDRDLVQTLELAAQLHDVGKIGIPDQVLKKRGKLTAEERRAMEEHCRYGKVIIEPLADKRPEALRRYLEQSPKLANGAGISLVALASRIALTHHERWDGAGYPLGLAGEDIPIEGRITAVADVFDALSSARSYKPPMALETCLAQLEGSRGQHFDPRVLDAFLSGLPEIQAAQAEHA